MSHAAQPPDHRPGVLRPARAAVRVETEAAGLGAPLDDDCSIATRVRDVSGPGYVASVETGTINRGIYEIAVPRNWNGNLIYTFGGGCAGGWYRRARRPAACSTT